MQAKNNFFFRAAWKAGVFNFIPIIFLALALASCSSGVTRPGLSENTLDVEQARKELAATGSELNPTRNLDSNQQAMEFSRAFNKVRPAAMRVCYRLRAQNCDAVESLYPEIIQDDSFNAYADINNKIGMHSGLLKRAGSDEEIAFVLAHEYGHIMGAHPATKMQNASAGALFGTLIGLVADASLCDSAESCDYGMTQTLGQTGLAIGAVAYSEDQELEADYYAGLILADAGIDLEAGSESLTRIALMANEGGSNASAFSSMLRTHPLGDRRLARWTVNRRAMEYAIARNLGSDELYIQDAAQQASDGDGQSPVAWVNPKTGSSGSVRADGEWTTEARRVCRRTIWTNDNRTLEARLRKGILNVCKS
ncbi:MAG: M48 family metalloprotease [Albidovulum sp.]|nr:M48 family metalloprotease [Albidovulum sp.]